MSAESDQDDRFIERLSNCQVRLRSYVFALVRDAANADDVLQNTCMALWKKRADYDPEREFFRWACGVALIEVLRFRRKSATERLLFDEALIEALAADYVESISESDLRRAALPKCLSKLNEEDRKLIEARYASGDKVEQIASQMNKPLSSVYRSLAKLREILLDCVRKTIAQESHPSI